jgi:hypothetical protein
MLGNSLPEAALLLLLRVQGDFLNLHFFNELPDPFVRQLIRHSGHNPSVVIDLLV